MKSFNCLPKYMKVYFEMDVVYFSLLRIKQWKGFSYSQGNEKNSRGFSPSTNPLASGKSVNLSGPLSSSVKPGSWVLWSGPALRTDGCIWGFLTWVRTFHSRGFFVCSVEVTKPSQSLPSPWQSAQLRLCGLQSVPDVCPEGWAYSALSVPLRAARPSLFFPFTFPFSLHLPASSLFL